MLLYDRVVQHPFEDWTKAEAAHTRLLFSCMQLRGLQMKPRSTGYYYEDTQSSSQKKLICWYPKIRVPPKSIQIIHF